ncbi:MAG: molybdopterin-dependent oxidoreductase, partial [Deltaproteobacteria bacterium]|nr:molybdopterin-dependent oxidoreductase [Deltaproteobacteria bacterium]
MENRYWKSPDELEAPLTGPTPESGGELPAGMSRREFLRLMGASLVMASAAACTRRPVEKIVPYLNKPEEITPGVANWYATTCGECPAACGVLAKTREGRPIKLEGNPEHPMNKGGLCARGQASLLNLYDPDRLQNPLRSNGAGASATWETVDWKKVDVMLTGNLDAIRKGTGSLRLLTGQVVSPSARKLIDQFVQSFPNAKHIVYEPLSLSSLIEGQKESYGQGVVPSYHFDRAELVLSFGADFLDTWISPVAFAKQFSSARKLENGKMSRLVVIEPATSLTGSNADLHLPVAPGHELKIALALAHELSGNESLAAYSIAKTAQATGIDEKVLQDLAKELAQHKGSSLVLGGSASLQGAEGLALHIAVNYLNAILGNDGRTVDAFVAPSTQTESSAQELLTLIDEMEQGKVSHLILWNTNPVYTLPASIGFAKALQKVEQVIAIRDRLDETASLAHWVLPESHYLESWGDAEPQKGLTSLRQPAIRPLYESRSF